MAQGKLIRKSLQTDSISVAKRAFEPRAQARPSLIKRFPGKSVFTNAMQLSRVVDVNRPEIREGLFPGSPDQV